MRNRIFIKCIVLVVSAGSALALFAIRAPQKSKAESDVILAEISKYKTWKKVNEQRIETLPVTSAQNSSPSKEPLVIAEPEGG